MIRSQAREPAGRVGPGRQGLRQRERSERPMTRSQVRAATRRMRDHVEEIEEEAGELNLVPYMDIVTNIIIFLLASVVNQVALGNINVSSPTIQAGGGAGSDEPPPEKPPLNLTITVGGSGYIV